MGDRAVVVFRDTREVHEVAVHLHWDGYRVEELLRGAAPRMRAGDATYAAARFIGHCHIHIEGALSLGVYGLSPKEVHDVASGHAGRMATATTASGSWTSALASSPTSTPNGATRPRRPSLLPGCRNVAARRSSSFGAETPRPPLKSRRPSLLCRSGRLFRRNVRTIPVGPRLAPVALQLLARLSSAGAHLLAGWLVCIRTAVLAPVGGALVPGGCAGAVARSGPCTPASPDIARARRPC